MATNRETVRDAFLTLVEAGLTSAQEHYGYRVGDFEGQSPVVVVSSAGQLPRRATMQGSRTTVRLQVDTFVLYSDGDSWGEDDAEDALDALAMQLAGVVDDNQNTANWFALSFPQMSARNSVAIGGQEYAHEAFLVDVECWG